MNPNELLQDSVTESLIARTSKFLGGCPHTTATLLAMAQVYRTEYGDNEGALEQAELLESFARQFAVLEAATM